MLTIGVMSICGHTMLRHNRKRMYQHNNQTQKLATCDSSVQPTHLHGPTPACNRRTLPGRFCHSDAAERFPNLFRLYQPVARG